MIHSLTTLKKKIRGFNTKQFTADDFWVVIKKERIIVHFWPLQPSVNGFYGVNRKYKRTFKYIVIDSKLWPNNWLSVAFHELIHHFLHQPAANLTVYFSKSNTSGKQDREADMFSLMMLIPKPLLLEMMEPNCDDIYQFSSEDLHARLAVYKTFGE